MKALKNGNKIGMFLLFVLMIMQIANGATWTVAKDGSGQYTSVQEAVDHAEPNDIIDILDNEIYEEQVNIDSTKTGLTLMSSSKLKPTIKWRDTKSTFPKSLAEAKDTIAGQDAEKGGYYFDQNGAVRLLRVQKVTIENIIIDGDEPFPFYGSGVWGQSDLFHGSAGLVLWISGDVVVRNCEMKNAYFGIAIKDRNIGGVFANINPNDNDSTKNVPLSGFGKTGNHLFEQNRIHDNSWGMFIESAWDRGSTVRYNLFYENHHYSDDFADEVSGMGGEGRNQSGGAVLLKDVKFSPVAFHNNTFWHNFLNIGGQWQIGGTHLIFNNIFGPPIKLWGEDKLNGNNGEMFTLDIVHPNRLKRNLHAVMKEWDDANVYIGMQLIDPADGQNVQSDPQNVKVQIPIISNDLRRLESGGYFEVTFPYSDGDVDTIIYTDNNQVYSPGAILLGKETSPFPVDAKNRWFEPVFKSTDPESPNFLVPDWDDSLMYEFVVDQGDPTAGILDADGSIADLGAIPFNGDFAKDKIIITPTQPAVINGTSAILSFRVHAIEGEITDPEIKYIRWIHNIPDNTNSWGTGAKPVPASGIVVPTGDIDVTMGGNTLNLTIPEPSEADSVSFFEIVVEGTGSNGRKVTSTVGFVPYRQLQYKFVIDIFDVTGKTKLDNAVVGEPVMMKIKPERIDGTPMRDAVVQYVQLALGSIEYKLKDENGKDLEFLNGVPTSGSEKVVMFTRIPDGGMEMITATGMFDTLNRENNAAIAGASDPIRILPGPPASIKFQDPPSTKDEKNASVIQPGIDKKVSLYVFDKYGNRVVEQADVTVSSLDEEIGKFYGETKAKNDSTGEVIFDELRAIGKKDETFQIRAKMEYNGVTAYDTTWLKVGKLTDRFMVYYSDAATVYDPTVSINACSSERVMVTIRSEADGVLLSRNDTFNISFDNTGLLAYASDTSSDPITTASLVKGVATIWVEANVQLIENGEIVITPNTRTILEGKRAGINFKYCDNPVETAFYYADNGNGTVNKVEILFEDPLTDEFVPDTMVFYWPDSSSGKRVISKFTVDAENPSLLKIDFDKPFDSLKTSGNSSLNLGECIRVDDNGDVNRQKFAIGDKVGPLVKSAIVVERPGETGDDTLYLTFTELLGDVKALVEDGLLLIKAGKSYNLNVVSAQNISADTIRVVVENTDNALSPKQGDSLRINPEGKVTDKAGNFAHKDNRPVKIDQKEIPPEIASAFYYDKNGDGRVDTVVIEFNKEVKLDALSAVFTWAGKSTGKIDASQFSFASKEKSNTVAVDLNSKFKGIDVKTFETMNLVLTYTSQGVSTDRKANVRDKAAPVITEAVYHPGSVDKGVPKPDTIHVTFSEKIEDSKSASSPFIFTRKSLDGGKYEIELKYLGESANTVKYLVNKFSTSSVEICEKGDSIKIKTPDIYADNNNNAQNVKNNRLVPVVVKSVPVQLDVKVGPNPFVVNGNNSVVIKLDPQTKKVDDLKIESVIKIYDAVGNVVYDEIRTESGKVLEFKWNGRNSRGRFVGSGTYLVVIDATNLKTGEKITTFRQPIGLKR